MYSAKDGKKVREKIRKLASKVEEDEFSDDLEMVGGFIRYKIKTEVSKSFQELFKLGQKIRVYYHPEGSVIYTHISNISSIENAFNFHSAVVKKYVQNIGVCIIECG